MKVKTKRKLNKNGFTPLFFQREGECDMESNPFDSHPKQTVPKERAGFTIIELLVVVAIIGLLASVVLVALTNARQKSRNTKRLADMVQMNNGLELYNAYNKGYPDVSTTTPGTPTNLAIQFMSSVPQDPGGSEGVCNGAFYPSGSSSTPPSNTPATRYYYVPYGNSYIINGQKVWGSYNYYFCLSQDTGNFPAGVHVMTPAGLQ